MAWERRTRGGLYYTRSKRVGGRVVREYLGCGEGARLVADIDAARREERAAERLQRDRERAGPLAVQDALNVLGKSLEDVLSVCLEAEGYHKHRGQWRRKRRA